MKQAITAVLPFCSSMALLNFPKVSSSFERNAAMKKSKKFH